MRGNKYGQRQHTPSCDRSHGLKACRGARCSFERERLAIYNIDRPSGHVSGGDVDMTTTTASILFAPKKAKEGAKLRGKRTTIQVFFSGFP